MLLLLLFWLVACRLLLLLLLLLLRWFWWTLPAAASATRLHKDPCLGAAFASALATGFAVGFGAGLAAEALGAGVGAALGACVGAALGAGVGAALGLDLARTSLGRMGSNGSLSKLLVESALEESALLLLVLQLLLVPPLLLDPSEWSASSLFGAFGAEATLASPPLRTRFGLFATGPHSAPLCLARFLFRTLPPLARRRIFWRTPPSGITSVPKVPAVLVHGRHCQTPSSKE